MTHDEEMKRASLYLSMDEKDLANMQAEHAKWEARRKTAIAYGDQGSPVEPVEFTPFSCRSCDDIINEHNRSPVTGQCVGCLQESIALRIWQQAEDQRKFEQRAKSAFASSSVIVALWFTALCTGAVLLGWAVAKLADMAMWTIGLKWYW